MLVLPSGEIVTDDEAEYAEMPPLAEDEDNSDKREERALEGEVGFGFVV
mgnify:FL=1